MSSTLKNKALDIAQRYCGMTPKDLGVETYAQMQEKMANEIVSLIDKNKILLVGAGAEDISIAEMAERSMLQFHKSMVKGTIDIHDSPIIKKFGFGETRDCNYLLTNVVKAKTDELLGKTQKLKAEVDEMEEKGVRGVTNNRKIKVRKKAKNGKKRK